MTGWDDVFCVEERRHAVDLGGRFGVNAVLDRGGRRQADPYLRYALFYGKAETAREVYFAACRLVDAGAILGVYVFADAWSVGDGGPCLMDSYVLPEDEAR